MRAEQRSHRTHGHELLNWDVFYHGADVGIKIYCWPFFCGLGGIIVRMPTEMATLASRPWAINPFYSHQRVHVIRIDCVWIDIRNTGRNHYHLLHKQHWVFAFDRTLTIDAVFQSCAFYGVPRILIADATFNWSRMPPSTDWHTCMASILSWYRSDTRRQSEFSSCFAVNFKSMRLWPCLL